ncbi:ATP-binding cassette domain-containing protein [Streptomyces poriferorum]|uniref:ATP-binding cassette domain-containing protein n=1 Tax=Streptomyces poriferorum TaxID=2798799 RepID=A0ABY9J3U7_9ACTN|nr:MULTISPECIES: ATP-binding cassette domain-containing protein [unclassified Streptomyces]MDP5311609.1 ATP-binding cassette domain-containing protein [Streptomyces sp. Alt4]WLQ53301.1 ATP-binding cassette domain-containing protein [Streptomyces sp. Alt1]WLQ61855.1 ATP-binding cassette domain-containing protein [Streptomyces sp. Alt2]WSI68216.1 ATP-binding cassette domain-containing protein [Streptomyces sp. NBC_01336]
MIEAAGVCKSFGDVHALNGVDIEVARGKVLGLLGHNGAGKTTLVNILSTVSPPTAGTVRVAGYDVTTQGAAVRARIGVTGQFASVDEYLSGYGNLVLIARLLGAGRRQAAARATELLELFRLTEAAKQPSRTYSGGMRRRLDLAASLVGRPDVLFLDEPTTGLDPTTRIALWETVEGLVADGTTVLLTTQYLDEADRLADWITVLSKGRVIASGTSGRLKAELGSRAVHAALTPDSDLSAATGALAAAGFQPRSDPERHALSTPVDTSADIAAVVRALDTVGAELVELTVKEPSLDDVYLALTQSPTALAGAA